MATKYKEPDRDTFLKRNQEAQSRFSGDFQGYWKYEAPAGAAKRHKIRVMPPHENMDDVFVETKMHFLPSTEIGKNGRPIPIGIVCLGVYGEPCAACKHVDALYTAAKGEDDPETVDKLKREAKDKSSKLRVFAQIVDLDHPEKNVQRFAFGPDIEKKLRNCFFDDDGEFRNITHPKTGRDVLFFAAKKPGTDFNTYDGTRAAESESKLADMDWLDKIEDLNVLIVKPSEADIASALKGIRPASQSAQSSKTADKMDKTEKSAKEKAADAKDAVKEGLKKEKPSRRQAVTDEDEDPYAAARKAIAAAKKEFKLDFEPVETTPDAIEKTKKFPPCYTLSTEVKDEMCQTCKALLPCATAMLAKGEKIAGNDD